MMNVQDYNKAMKDMMGSFPVDMTAFQDAFKTQAVIGEKLSKVALEAADKSAEISNNWTKATIAKVGVAAKVKEDVSDYNKVVSDFASAQTELASENLAAFAEIAKKVQMETVELMMAAGKDFNEDATAAVNKATANVKAAGKKAAK